jgi:hypothetical protein
MAEVSDVRVEGQAVRGSWFGTAAQILILYTEFRRMILRFASVQCDVQPLAVAIEDDRAVPLKGATELGRATPVDVLRDPPEYPVLFTKFAVSLTGPFDDIRCPQESAAVDFEGELAVIVGRRTRRVSPKEALNAVAGYAAANDVLLELSSPAARRSAPTGPSPG